MYTLFTAMKKCLGKSADRKWTKITAWRTLMNYMRIICFSQLLDFSEINVLGSHRIFWTQVMFTMQKQIQNNKIRNYLLETSGQLI